VSRCSYIAAQATVLHLAQVGEGACVAVGALVHARAVVPAEHFVPPHATAIGDPVRVLSADRADELAEAIREVGFTDAAFGVPPVWTDRAGRYRQVAEVRSAEYAAHADDTILE
jgi:hypothetical protein